MRTIRLAACVAIVMCLAATAWGSNWTGGEGDWSLGSNWSDGVPNGTSAYIGNSGTPTIDSLVDNITTLDVAWFSGLEIEDGAGLTATSNANVAGGGNDFVTVTQSGGVVSLEGNLSIGTGSDDTGIWGMTVNGSLAVGADLTLGGDGDGYFDVAGTSNLTVGGGIDIASGRLTVSGGALGQLAGGGDPAILADLAVNGGSFKVEGDAAAINVASYTQESGGALDLDLGNGGISPINIAGNMTLGGAINVTLGAGTPDGIYDILIADGIRSGVFVSENLPEGVAVRYEIEGGNYVAKLYVNEEPPPPGGAGDVISVNTSWVDEVSTMLDPNLHSSDIAGAEGMEAENWNNVDVSAGTSVPHSHEPIVRAVDVSNLVGQAGDPTVVGMKLSGRQPCQSLPNSQDPHGSPVPEQNGPGTIPDYVMMHTGPASRIDDEGLPNWLDYMQLELTRLSDQFPQGYDVVIYYGDGGHPYAGRTGHTVVTGPGTYSEDTEVTPFTPRVAGVTYPMGANIGLMQGWMNQSEWGYTNYSGDYLLSTDTSTPGNYQVISGLMLDTLTLTFVPTDDVEAGAENSWPEEFTVLGLQLMQTTSPLKSLEFIVDNMHTDFWSRDGLTVNHVIDAWVPYPDAIHEAWYGRKDSWAQWTAPALPFVEPTEYEVFTWVGATNPNGTTYPRDAAALYSIKDAYGVVHEIIFDQNTAPGSWVSLGKYFFSNDGAPQYVLIESSSTSTTGTVTSYDAVRWLWTPPEIQVVGPVPEPASLGLIGLALLAVRRRRRA